MFFQSLWPYAVILGSAATVISGIITVATRKRNCDRPDRYVTLTAFAIFTGLLITLGIVATLVTTRSTCGEPDWRAIADLIILSISTIAAAAYWAARLPPLEPPRHHGHRRHPRPPRPHPDGTAVP